MAFTALFDACVLYPAPLRDLLLNLACTGLFRARWSAQIHDEWIRNLSKARPELADKLQRTRDAMDRAVPDCLVTDYEGLIDCVTSPDANDRHVVAAAIVGRADVIVTFNLKDFPARALAPYRVEAQHPDVFVRHVLDLDNAAALSAVRAHRSSLKSPPKTVEEYLASLARQGLPETVMFLRRWTNSI